MILAQRYPDAHRLAWGWSQELHANALLAAGDAKALATARSAVEMLDQEAKRYLPAVARYLARALEVLARCLAAAGREDGAIAAARQALDTIVPEFRRRPKALHYEMGRVAGTLRQLGRGDLIPPEIDV